MLCPYRKSTVTIAALRRQGPLFQPINNSHEMLGDWSVQKILIDVRERMTQDEVDLILSEGQTVWGKSCIVEIIGLTERRHNVSPPPTGATQLTYVRMQLGARCFVARSKAKRVATTQHRHEKAVRELYSCYMRNAPKHLNQCQDLKRWDNEGGAPRSGRYSRKEPSSLLLPKAEPALYYFNIRTPNGLIEDPEGSICTSPQTARKAALASARVLIAEGYRAGEDRRGWRFEIMDRSNQHVLKVMFSEVSVPKSDDPS